MLKKNFLSIILLFSLCFEGSFAELQHGDKCTDSSWERRCGARRAACGFFPPIFVVLNAGGCPGSFFLGTSEHICPLQQAALCVCTGRTGTNAFLSINPWCRSILRELGVCSYSSAYPILCHRGAFQLEYSSARMFTVLIIGLCNYPFSSRGNNLRQRLLVTAFVEHLCF